MVHIYEAMYYKVYRVYRYVYTTASHQWHPRVLNHQVLRQYPFTLHTAVVVELAAGRETRCRQGVQALYCEHCEYSHYARVLCCRCFRTRSISRFDTVDTLSTSKYLGVR